MIFNFRSSTPARTRASILLLCSTGAAAAIAVVACAGRGMTYSQIEPATKASCASCHDSAGFDQLLTSIRALDDAKFDEASFPTAHFPSGLVPKTTADLIREAKPATDGTLDANTAQRKAWVLHEMHELKALLGEGTPPDYTSQAAFDKFVAFGQDGAYEGCELGEKLDLGHQNDPEGMPPRWAKKLFELLEKNYAEPTPDERQKIRDYTDGLLPGGLRACQPGQDSAS